MSQRLRCVFSCDQFDMLHRFPKPHSELSSSERFKQWKDIVGQLLEDKDDIDIYTNYRICNHHFENRFLYPQSKRLAKTAYPTLKLESNRPGCSSEIQAPPIQVIQSHTGTKLEVCVDSLESAVNAIQGGADELEVCSSLVEGGLTPSPGLVKEIMQIIKNQVDENLANYVKPKLNVMIRCRGGSDFCYTDNEMKTMLSDIEVYKEFGVDRFVFGALTSDQKIDTINCIEVIERAYPIPVTFHRAFDVCKESINVVKVITDLGFTRILTSGRQPCAADEKALLLLESLLKDYSDKIEIMPGAGINCDNADIFVKSGFSIIHSSCKKLKALPDVGGDLNMGVNEIYVTDESTVKKLKEILK